MEDRNLAMAQSVEMFREELNIVKAELGYAKHSIGHLLRIIRESRTARAREGSEDVRIPLSLELPSPGGPERISGSTFPTTPPRSAMDVSSPILGDTEASVGGSVGGPVRGQESDLSTATSDSRHIVPPSLTAQATRTADLSTTWRGITDRAAADILASEQLFNFLGPPDPLGASTDARQRTFADDITDRLPTGLPVERAVPALIETSARLAAELDRMERRGQM